MSDPNLQAAQQTIDSLNAEIVALKQRPILNLKDVVKARIPGWNGKLGVDVMGWFGHGSHRVTRYNSNDPAVVKAQLDNMQAVGFEFARLTWQGAGNFVDQTAGVLIPEIARRGMKFVYLLDPWIAKGQTNPTQVVIDQLKGRDSVLAAPYYLKDAIDNRPLVCEFSLGGIGVDVNKVRQALPGLNILSWHAGFSWPNVGTNGAGQLATLKTDHAKASMRIASLNLGFNDAGFLLPDGSRDYCHSVWEQKTPARVIDHQAGNWFFDQVATIPATMQNIAVPTWNDHDEETGIEQFIAMLTGIRVGA